jgi:hypothetical protein
LVSTTWWGMTCTVQQHPTVSTMLNPNLSIPTSHTTPSDNLQHKHGTNMLWWPSNLGPWQCMGDSGVPMLPSDGMGEGRAMLMPSCVGGVVTGEVYTSHNTNNKHLHQAGGHLNATNALYMACSHQHPTTHTSTSTMGVWGVSCTKHCSITGDGMWPNHNV